jgi:hypothetical protein
MNDKLEIIMKTAKMLADDYNGTWTGNVHEFATASGFQVVTQLLSTRNSKEGLL